jgi:farnesyl-diphosphate farnesyltransferase
MGQGMAEFAAMESVTGTKTKKEYNRYCHYVAGLVGIGLSKLFAASGLEAASVGRELDRANEMGLFLQKTNIIRDYLEDLEDGRTWYPEEVWSKHVGSLSDMKEAKHKEKALACLNELVTDALQHIPSVYAYMGALKNQSVFNFCAIPQVMAIATLANCYNNPAVFKGVVKIRKGTALQLMMRATDMDAVYSIFDEYTFEIKNKMVTTDVSLKHTKEVLASVDELLDSAKDAGVFTSDRVVAVPSPLRMPVAIGLVGYAIYAFSR